MQGRRSLHAKQSCRRDARRIRYAMLASVAVHMWRAMLRLTRHPAAPRHTRTKERITVRYDSSAAENERVCLAPFRLAGYVARQVHPAKPDVRDDRHAHARVQTLRAGR